ncbi:MAG: DnaA/Hda family protein, partial [Enterococcus sp.]
MSTYEALWQEVLNSLKNDLSPASFQVWAESASPLSLQNDELLIKVPTKVHRDYCEKNLAPRVLENSYRLYGREIMPAFITEDEVQEEMPQVKEEKVEEKVNRSIMLNPKYTFDTFVIGQGNQMAHAAAQVVAEEPGSIYNPLFFYGGVGLGKTHLMHAIGHELLKYRPNAKIKYVSSENFTNDFITSIKNRTSEEFRHEYRSVDLLLVDDIQFLE